MSNRIEFEEIDKKDDDGYEKICFMCHRPESVAGKMIDLPNNICQMRKSTPLFRKDYD